MALDVGAKVLLVLAMTRVALDPTWGNLEGKAPGTRALVYPLVAFLVPLWCLWRGPGRPYPWLADLMLTLPGFSDVLGNRLDLFDRISWFDDFMHFFNTGTLSGAVVVLCGAAHAPLVRRLELAVAAGMTLALTWEVWEYLAFVTRSGEAGTAYADTVWDLALGWLGAVVAAVLLGSVRLWPGATAGADGASASAWVSARDLREPRPQWRGPARGRSSRRIPRAVAAARSAGVDPPRSRPSRRGEG
jgi:hypothetical protein